MLTIAFLTVSLTAAEPHISFYSYSSIQHCLLSTDTVTLSLLLVPLLLYAALTSHPCSAISNYGSLVSSPHSVIATPTYHCDARCMLLRSGLHSFNTLASSASCPLPLPDT